MENLKKFELPAQDQDVVTAAPGFSANPKGWHDPLVQSYRRVILLSGSLQKIEKHARFDRIVKTEYLSEENILSCCYGRGSVHKIFSNKIKTRSKSDEKNRNDHYGWVSGSGRFAC